MIARFIRNKNGRYIKNILTKSCSFASVASILFDYVHRKFSMNNAVKRFTPINVVFFGHQMSMDSMKYSLVSLNEKFTLEFEFR